MDNSTEQHKEELRVARLRQNEYRTVFGTSEGKRVLSDMLLNLGFFEPIETEEDRFLYNFAIELQTILGIRHESNLTNLGDLLLRFPENNFLKEES